MPLLLQRAAWITAAALLGSAGLSLAQQPATPPKPPDAPATPTPSPTPAPSAPQPTTSDDGFTTLDSTVGYIDSAIPWTQVRLRFDAAYGLNVPNRAEFFYAQPKPGGPGLPLPERNIDYQELNAYGEMLIVDRFSVFAEVPVRFLNPEVNADQTGLSDVSAGSKFALVMKDNLISSLQLRVTAPSGNASLGLGTRHVTVEPGWLNWYKLNDRWGFESELRFWTPIGGTDFAGEIIRYGVGVYHNLYLGDYLRIAPVAEFVGWSVLGGKERFLLPSGIGVTQGAGGDTILNAKLGVRFGFGKSSDLYVGYGRPLTGDRWYENDFRIEFRHRF